VESNESPIVAPVATIRDSFGCCHELGELAAARVVNTTAAKTALGALYPAADRGAAMTDDQLVAYLDRTVARITSKPISRATLFRAGCGEKARRAPC